MAELLTFFIILVAGLVFSEIFDSLHLPYVAALIISGIVFGPHALNIVHINPVIEFLSSIGLIFLMFIAGTEIKSQSIRAIKNKALILAAFNGLVPLIIGIALGFLLGYSLTTAVILGIIFISSSVGVIIPSLERSHLTTTNLGKTIITSTVIEDITSLLLLAFVLQTVQPKTQIPLFLYLPLLLIIIFLLKGIVPRLEKSYHKGKRGQDLFESEVRFIFVLLISIVILFEIIGLHAIIAGFITGMILSDAIKGKIPNKIRTLSYGVFIPTFFFTIGAQMDLSVFLSKTSIFIISLIVFSLILSKITSGFLGAKTLKFSNRASLLIAFSTLPQLSTSLAAAFAALSFGLLTNEIISAIIVLTIITTLITPFLIKWGYKICKPSDLE